MMLKKWLFVPTLLCLTSLVGGAANATSFTLTLTEATDGGVLVTGSGTGIITNGVDPDGGLFSNGPTGEDDFDFADFETAFLAAAAGTSGIDSDVDPTGTVTNVTTGISSLVEDIQFDADTTSGNDIDFDTVDNLVFNEGDEFALDFTVGFTVGTLPFSNLVPGTHTLIADPTEPNSAGFAEEIFGNITVVVAPTAVPEPGAGVLALLAMTAAAAVRMRSKLG